MGTLGRELVKRLGIFVIGNLLIWGGIKAIDNIADGKTVFGKKKAPKEKTYVNWRGNVILGTNDGWVS